MGCFVRLFLVAAIGLVPSLVLAGFVMFSKDYRSPRPVTVEQQGEQEPQKQEPELSDMELIEHVAFLQRQLESPEIPKRDAAEKELISLGVRVLDYLEPATDKTPTDAAQRTTSVRLALEKLAVASVTKSSIVTLKGTMTIKNALASLRKQSNNDVDVLGETPDLFVDKEVTLTSENVSFWEALAELMKEGELVVDAFGGTRGQLRLTPTMSSQFRAANPGAEEPGAPILGVVPAIPRCTAGIFDVSVTEISASRNLLNPAQNYCNIQMQVRWEPRVMPISIDLPAATIKAFDESDTAIVLANEQAVHSGLVQPEVSNLNFQIPIALIDRDVKTIKSFEATMDAVLPGRTEKFRFRKLGNLEAGVQQTKAGATVTFGGIQKNEDLFGVTVRLSFDEEHNALESHQSWVYNNQIYLENEAGERFEALAYEGVKQAGNEVAIRYYFEPDPKAMTLHYSTPAAIVQIPIKIKLTNIPLP
ncbi:MAG: hypothetical protein ACI87E_000754 [Mariniblastus sp.]|jgi:hypothetical protein